MARQPIYDRDLRVVGYELLFRGGAFSSDATGNGDEATSRTLLTALTEIGLDTLVGHTPAFVNVTRGFLLDGHVRVCPANRFVLEVLEDVAVDDELLEALYELKADGYQIALDDFTYRPEVRPLVELADLVKLDVLALGDELSEHVALLRPLRVQLVAEKVETQQELDLCRSLGFDFLQGYFFCKPRTIEGRGVAPGRLSRLQLLASLNDPDVELEELSTIVERDIGLSYRLLRYVNSAYVGLPNQVDSIRRALVLIGLNKIRSWANLFALGQIDDAPSELLTTAMARARMCELLAPQLRLPPQTAFTVGLFSVLDALMNQDMASVLEQLPLSAELNDALLHRHGELGELLARVLAYEAGTLDGEGLEMCDQYIEAIAWTDQARSLVRAA